MGANDRDDRKNAPDPPVEAQRHAPTLMAGETPGEQGEVRIWAPHPWRLRADLLSDVGLAIFFIGLVFLERYIDALVRQSGTIVRGMGEARAAHPSVHVWVFAILAISCLFSIRGAYQRLRRPRYLTTDDAGIGITMRRGSRSLLWSDIRTARCEHGSPIFLETAGGKVKIALPGYPRALCTDLFGLIVNRANLYRNPANYYQFVPQEQVKNWFRARSRDPKLERPLPANQKPARDRSAFLAFVLALLAIPTFALSPLWLGIWAHNFLSRIEDPFPLGRFRASGQVEMRKMLNDLRGSDQHPRGNATVPTATATIWVDRPLGWQFAEPLAPGRRALAIDAEWAPVSTECVGQDQYDYQITFLSPPGPRSHPRSIAASLQSGGSVRSFQLRASNAPTNDDIWDAFSNRWWSVLNPVSTDGPSVGALPSPRRWRFAGISVYDTRPITWIKLANAPVREYFMPASGRHPAAAVATWLPGQFEGDQLTCDIIYQDGGARHLILSPGVRVRGIKVRWKMPAKWEKELSNGPI